MWSVASTDWVYVNAQPIATIDSVSPTLIYTNGTLVPDSPLVDSENPFGENFDTSYVYGPIHGRNLGFGFRWFQR